MKIVDSQIEKTINQKILRPITQGDYEAAVASLPVVLDYLYSQIPENRRASYGRVHTIKVLSQYLFTQLNQMDLSVYPIASKLYELSDKTRNKGVALGIISYYGLSDYREVLDDFADAAASLDWEIREFAQMFFRKITQKYPKKVRGFLLTCARSKNPNLRRFAAETLRPVQENRWIYSNPDYSVSILELLFSETVAYPRTSVGNNLSDLGRRLPELIYRLVEKLVMSGDKNSFWIAYRACRNLVKKDPQRVMDLLGVDTYRYKKRIHHRGDIPALKKVD
jgi:3-methyladenine DNA glycosylase AlkC